MSQEVTSKLNSNSQTIGKNLMNVANYIYALQFLTSSYIIN